MASDNSGVYCGMSTGSNLQVHNDGSLMPIGAAASTSAIVTDDENVYWIDATAAGAILKVSKSGGTPVTLAKDPNPTAIAVDAVAVYWGDQGGSIKGVPK